MYVGTPKSSVYLSIVDANISCKIHVCCVWFIAVVVCLCVHRILGEASLKIIHGLTKQIPVIEIQVRMRPQFECSTGLSAAPGRA